ncbi:Gfo/Idh/MocA family oxidoreductase [Nakamurella flavida]|uniref:Gfo/Idh/MocA family oxidoreductase n=1 Tax=Nakamurella flavida TaxID=363630 RepID=A0A938YD73_9ACTN|nr:Gfo/Idh/MocA family oxidoreductase [Nakamurella flavida]MBM9475407.1 Gfo/Idh/MocA family oxidoreductase [Nakamurella flavida]MBM9475505.1 Gfo/Idh/MocA family oxidoreductase [Nakamurella flavida]MDP9776987.1 putative dehydrogenase [Nakamurella flavida]
MSTQQTVNVAIIGGGLMGREIAAAIARWPALIDHPVRPRLTAVCDINPAALTWFEQIDTVTTTTTDYHDLLTDDAIDVVYVAVRHDLHEQLYGDVIRAGKSLLAEKPFGIDGPAAESVLAAMAEHPESFVRCSSEMPFFPGAQWAIRYVQSGALGTIVRANNSFLHSSDLDVSKPINWKRQTQFCGEAGVMNDLGLHGWHVPLRLGWAPTSVYAMLQNIVPERTGPDGTPVPCDTWDNADLHCWSEHEGVRFPLTVSTRRIDPGQKNTWEFEAIGMDGGVRFSTKNPKQVEVFAVRDIPGIGKEQAWQQIDVGSQSVWPTVTGGIFESGFSDSILQMWAAFLAERAGELGDRFGAARPEEAAHTHTLYAAAARSNEQGAAVAVPPLG